MMLVCQLELFYVTDVNMGFQQAARNVLLEDEGTLQRFGFTIDAKYIQQQLRSKRPSYIPYSFYPLTVEYSSNINQE